jgi:hypothetical protein
MMPDMVSERLILGVILLVSVLVIGFQDADALPQGKLGAGIASTKSILSL